MENGEKIKNLKIGKKIDSVSLQKEPILEGELTGYASIDRPWLKYYSEEATNGNIPSCKIYTYIKELIKNHENSYCFEFFGKKITCKEFLNNVETVARSFKTLEVKEGEIVSLISPTTPEAIYTVYALNMIGASCNIIDPRLGIENLQEKTMYSKYVVSIDLAKPKVEKALTENQKSIYYNVSNSFSLPLKLVIGLKKLFSRKDKRGMNWTKFLSLSKQCNEENIESEYKENQVAVIVSTSGTSGKSKLAQLTNENINSVAWQYGNSGIPHNLGDTFLNIMPLFLSYGIVAGIHMPLALGFKNVIIPQRDLKKMGHYLLKYRPQAYLDIPAGFDSLMSDPKIHSIKHIKFNFKGKTYKLDIERNVDLSFLNNPGVGGDHLNENLENQTNKFLNEHNNSKKVQKGYGMTEVSSAAIVNVSDECNSVNSVGIPFPKTIVKIVNPDTLEEVKYNEIGELLISSPAIFKGYLGNDSATNMEILYDEDGTKWIRTGDLFTINENGELFFKERMKTMFVRPDGHNNHPNIMNELILKHPKVLEACTVGVKSPNHEFGKFPKTVVVLKKEYIGLEEEVQKELEDMCMREFSQRDVPYFYEFRDSLPITPNGKIDYRLLESEGIGNSIPANIYQTEFGNSKVLKKIR